MSTTPGTLSKVSVGPTSSNLLLTAATGGQAPYTYQYYRSTTTGFTPGSGNLIAGATSLALIDTGLTPGTTYYYTALATDANLVVGAQYTELAVVTPADASQDSNQFVQTPLVGQVDQKMSFNTQPAVIDDAETATLYAGQAVKQVATTSNIMHVVACTSATDRVDGFINYNQKNPTFKAGMAVEISRKGNVLYLMPTVTGTLPCAAQLDVVTPGGVAPVVGSSGAEIVGEFYDKPTVGVPARVTLGYISHTKA